MSRSYPTHWKIVAWRTLGPLALLLPLGFAAMVPNIEFDPHGQPPSTEDQLQPFGLDCARKRAAWIPEAPFHARSD